MQKLLVLLITVWVLVGCTETDDPDFGESTEFTRAAVQPDWFAKTKTHPLESWDDVQTLWRSEKHCCGNDFGVKKANREFYKSCYRAIQKKPADPNLEPYCLWLMDVALDYDDSIQLSRYLLKNHSQYQQPINYCANCSPGDLIARVTRDVAIYEANREKKPFEASARLERLLDEQESRISFWVLGEIYESLADMYLQLPSPEEKIPDFRARIDRLELIWPADENQQWRLDNVRKAYSTLLEASDR